MIFRTRAFVCARWCAQALMAARLMCISIKDLVLPSNIYAISCLAPELFLGFESVRNHWQASVLPAIQRWYRYAALVGDRASLVVSQHVPTVASMILKLAAGSAKLSGALNVDALLDAAHNLDFISNLREEDALNYVSAPWCCVDSWCAGGNLGFLFKHLQLEICYIGIRTGRGSCPEGRGMRCETLRIHDY